MVVTKVFQIKHSNKLKDAVDYIENEEKTKQNILTYDGKLEDKLFYIMDEDKTEIPKDTQYLFKDGKECLVSCYGLISADYGYDEMMMTKMIAKHTHGDRQGGKTDVLAHHIIQSFLPDDKLTPEEVHEVGRRTVLELTGGEHEFVIATHMDKDHLHNHIIFNTTNNVTLKKFRWQKGTKKSLENISDKHADFFGAKIIDNEKRFGHKEYMAYISKHSFRREIKRRLDFLKKHSVSLGDFLEKARALNLEIDFSKKEAAYRLLDAPQQRNVRDKTLSKKGHYSKHAIEKFIEDNEQKSALSTDDILSAYNNYKKYKEDEFEIRFTLEDWQIVEETNRGIYLNVDFGINNSGTIFIDNKKYDKLENGMYDVFIKYSDYFYFTNPKHAKENRLMKGYAVARQLSLDNSRTMIKKNYHINRLDTLVEEFNYLSANHITTGEQFEQFVADFKDQVQHTTKELDRLDSRLAELNKLQSVLMALDNTNGQSQLAKEMLAALKLPKEMSLSGVERLVNEVKIERDLLHHKFNDIVKRFDYTQGIQKHVRERQQTNKLVK